MSTHYDVYCRTCSSALHLYEASIHEARSLLRLAPDLAALAKATTVFRTSADAKICTDPSTFSRECVPTISCRTMDYPHDYLGPQFDERWFLEHEGHNLAVQMEGGAFDDECAEWTKCSECGDSHHCRLSKRHDGPCSPRPPEAPR